MLGALGKTSRVWYAFWRRLFLTAAVACASKVHPSTRCPGDVKCTGQLWMNLAEEQSWLRQPFTHPPLAWTINRAPAPVTPGFEAMQEPGGHPWRPRPPAAAPFMVLAYSATPFQQGERHPAAGVELDRLALKASCVTTTRPKPRTESQCQVTARRAAAMT